MEAHSVRLFDEHGNVMVDIASVERKGDDIVMRGKMMGSMPGVFVIRPSEVWSATRLLSWPVIRFVPKMVFTGWRQSRGSSASSNQV